VNRANLSVNPVKIGRATLYLGRCEDVMPTLGAVDHIITDPPYSERTHRGHDVVAGACRDNVERIALGYECLDTDLVQILARLFCEATEGWIVWMTDHTLAPAIERALSARERYVFAPLPYFHAGRSVRLTGDGPCSWTDWIIPARTKAQSKWGTLPGGYIAGEGWNDKERMGGKPTRLMRLLVTRAPTKLSATRSWGQERPAWPVCWRAATSSALRWTSERLKPPASELSRLSGNYRYSEKRHEA
jgi:hypothetical protein